MHQFCSCYYPGNSETWCKEDEQKVKDIIKHIHERHHEDIQITRTTRFVDKSFTNLEVMEIRTEETSSYCPWGQKLEKKKRHFHNLRTRDE